MIRLTQMAEKTFLQNGTGEAYLLFQCTLHREFKKLIRSSRLLSSLSCVNQEVRSSSHWVLSKYCTLTIDSSGPVTRDIISFRRQQL